MKHLKRELPTRMRHISYPPNLPLAPRSPKDSKSAINARMPTPYAFSRPQTFEDSAGSGDEAEDNEPEGTEEVLMATNARTEGAEAREFDTSEESLVEVNNGKGSCQEIGVEISKIVLVIRFGNTLKDSVEFKILTWDPSLEAIHPSCKLEVFFKKIYSAAKVAALGIISPQISAEKISNLTCAVETALKDMQRSYEIETEELVESDFGFFLHRADDSRRLVSLKCNALNFTSFSFSSLFKDKSYNITCSEVAADVTIERYPLSSKEVGSNKFKIHHTRETAEASWAGESNAF